MIIQITLRYHVDKRMVSEFNILIPEGRTIWGNLLHMFNSAEGFETLFNFGGDNRL